MMGPPGIGVRSVILEMSVFVSPLGHSDKRHRSLWGRLGEGLRVYIFGSISRSFLKGTQPPGVCKLTQVWELIEGS